MQNRENIWYEDWVVGLIGFSKRPAEEEIPLFDPSARCISIVFGEFSCDL